MKTIRKNKLILTIAVVLLLTIGIFSGCVEDKPETGKIRYGGQYYPGEFLLQGNDFWDEYNIDVEHTLFSSGTENNQALISGDVDINCGSDSKTVSLFNSLPDDAVILCTIQQGNRYSTMVKTGSTYQTWMDLVGQTVATRLGTGAEQVLRRYFDQNESLSWDDFTWVNLNVEDMASALDAGTIEAFTAWEPTPGIAEAQGIGRVLRSYGDIALVPVCLHTTLDYAKEYRDEIVKFLAAHLDKEELIKNDPEQAADLAAQAAADTGIEVTSDAFLTMFNRIDFTLELNSEILAAINDTAQFLFDQEKIDSIPTLRWDDSFLKEAKELREQ
jgi:ABC-type nitrate/sulfonate/bicarbonate transport system substrate-binding protein